MKPVKRPTFFAACTTVAGLAALLPSMAQAHDNQVEMTTLKDELCFTGNGLPDHSTSKFPNSGNPHAIAAQMVAICVNASPSLNA